MSFKTVLSSIVLLVGSLLLTKAIFGQEMGVMYLGIAFWCIVIFALGMLEGHSISRREFDKQFKKEDK